MLCTDVFSKDQEAWALDGVSTCTINISHAGTEYFFQGCATEGMCVVLHYRISPIFFPSRKFAGE